MPPFVRRPETAHHESRGGAAGDELRSVIPRTRAGRGLGHSPALGDAALGDDYWAAEVDLLILRVADRLRRAGADLPNARLRQVAEQVVLDAACFVLDWVEASAAAGPVWASEVMHAPSPGDAPLPADAGHDAPR